MNQDGEPFGAALRSGQHPVCHVDPGQVDEGRIVGKVHAGAAPHLQHLAGCLAEEPGPSTAVEEQFQGQVVEVVDRSEPVVPSSDLGLGGFP